jgi:hypothetical protein
MNFDDRVKAVARFGFTDRQARFLVTVMLHAGVCVPRQYARFAGTAYGHNVTKFFDRLVQGRVASVCRCLHNRAELFTSDSSRSTARLGSLRVGTDGRCLDASR